MYALARAYLTNLVAERGAAALARYVKPPVKHPPTSLEISIASAEQLQARGTEVTWLKDENPALQREEMGEDHTTPGVDALFTKLNFPRGPSDSDDTSGSSH